MSVDAIRHDRQSRWRVVWTIARRELGDTLRDWRIIFPIVGLTLLFPWLMNWTAQTAVEFVQQQNADLIGERLIPFLLMIVGFFPMSFSLVIALETFVGEKERRSIEPLLSMPISDLELYLGKMVAATALPLIGSILGISVYLAGLQLTIGYVPPVDLIAQIFALNVITALVMVSGAVVISSQTTSVRAANLLASFIIVPTAILIQAESIVMFWGNYRALWTIALGLLVVMTLLVRMGVNTFNREEILGREIDELNLRRLLRLARHYFVQPPTPVSEAATSEGPASAPQRLAGWVERVYRHDLPYLLRRNWAPILLVIVSLVGAWILGWMWVEKLPLPEGTLVLQNLSEQDFQRMSDVSFLPSLTTSGIFWHNVRVLLLAALLAVISLGVLPVLLLMFPLIVVAFLAGQFAWQGQSALTFVGAFVAPHGVFEIPAAVLATAFALRVGAAVTATREGLTVGEGVVAAAADLVKVFLFIVVPVLLVAAFVEANVTPQVVLWVYGG